MALRVPLITRRVHSPGIQSTVGRDFCTMPQMPKTLGSKKNAHTEMEQALRQGLRKGGLMNHLQLIKCAGQNKNVDRGETIFMKDSSGKTLANFQR